MSRLDTMTDERFDRLRVKVFQLNLSAHKCQDLISAEGVRILTQEMLDIIDSTDDSKEPRHDGTDD